MTRVAADDWEGLARRVKAARWIGERGYGGDRASWEVSQLLQWQLTIRGNYRPTEPGDVHVLDALYAVENAQAVNYDLPTDLSPTSFTERLHADLKTIELDTSAWSPQGGSANELEWYGWALSGGQWCFTHYLAAVSLRVPFASARLIYQNLGDEAGRDADTAHPSLAERFLRHCGVNRTVDGIIAHVSPEHAAMLNMRVRHAWNPNPCAGIGAMLVDELNFGRLAPVISAHMRKLGLAADVVEFYREHVDADPHHAEDLLRIAANVATTPEHQRILYNCAMDAAYWWGENLSRNRVNIIRLREKREWARLPARELHEASGL
jgi:hypothetical protein